MPPKQKTPAPIDRPISRAYLRQFTGWSTAYPPGVSDPTSLRLMENVMVNREGSLSIRPGLRYLSISNGEELEPIDQEVVGTHEPFYLNNGKKAYLFAVREDDDTVGFRVLGDPDGTGLRVRELDDVGIDFQMLQGYAAICFSPATSYVKYLQIDNKIYALSNAGDTMRQFEVGSQKVAKRLNSIERPLWSVPDKLTVVHPETSWVASGVPTGVRTNLALNPSAETNLNGWAECNVATEISRSTTQAMAGGTASIRVERTPSRINLMPYPLADPVTVDTGWTPGSGAPTIGPGSGWETAGFVGASTGYVNGPVMEGVEAGHTYRLSMDYNRVGGVVVFSGKVRWYTGTMTQIGADVDFAMHGVALSGRSSSALVAPTGSVYMQFFLFVDTVTSGLGGGYMQYRNFLVEDALTDPTAAVVYFDGDSGADYTWEGTADASRSFYTPDSILWFRTGEVSVTAAYDYAASIYAKAGTTARDWTVRIQYLDGSYASTGVADGALTGDVNTSFSRMESQDTAPVGTLYARVEIFSDDVDIPLGEYHYFDHLLFENSLTVDTYFDGSTTDTSTEVHGWSSTVHNSSSTETLYSTPATTPTAATPTSDTLISSDAAENVYSVGFFYTFSNEVGESAASQVTVVKVQRGWSQWKWELGTAGAPNGTATTDPALCADQLVAYMPSTTFQEALDQGATKWSLYMLTWSNQDPAPVTAIRLSTKPMVPGSVHGTFGWNRMSPQQADANAEIAPLPSEVTRYNYSNPSRAGQGLVAADRMIMVFDPAAPAVIRWSSNEQGNYTDFSASRGGGYKTLTSGNLYVPACVKLWQNPQSTDTLTILCMGVDGQSTGYYMAPAQIASQSEAVNIMGFEETTATPGTVSPFGVEVLNNALYHPLDEMIMKSTATNYNINHASITDVIQNVWRGLQTKERVVSSQYDNRIYYLVNNPLGDPLEEGCWGNEVWVFDAQQKAGTWSRWKVQGHSLRKFEQGGQIVMSLVRPDGIYYFDETYTSDDYVVGGELGSRNIEWYAETNTQGANRAHDAWAHVQQVNIVVGNFLGKMTYGVKGLDLHGKWRDISKVTRDQGTAPADGTTYDLEDTMLVRHDLKEWFFYAGSVTEDDVVQHSEGQLSLVQYRYTPVTVNVGYEQGTVESFEYGRSANEAADRTTDAGVPMPYVDTRRP